MNDATTTSSPASSYSTTKSAFPLDLENLILCFLFFFLPSGGKAAEIQNYLILSAVVPRTISYLDDNLY